MKVEVLGYESLREVLPADSYFNPILLALERGDMVDGYSLIDDYLFHGACLCSPEESMQLLIMR